MAAKHPATELAKHLGYLYDQIRGPLATIQDNDMEASEMARRELCVILECLADEARAVQRTARGQNRAELYGPEASGRFLACLGIPAEHRAWKRLSSVEERAGEEARRKRGEVAVTLGPDLLAGDEAGTLRA